MRHLFIILLLNCLLVYTKPGFSQNKSADSKNLTGNCISANKLNDRIIFNCENNIKVSLKVINGNILQLHFSKNNFKLSNKSFAVTDSVLSKTISFGFSEQPTSYEVYTDKLIVRISKSPFKIRVFDKWQKLLMEDYKNQGFIVDSSWVSSSKTLRVDEQIYGLGEKNGTISRNGQKIKMWNSDKPCYSVNEDPLYKSIPFFMSSVGYGIFFDNTYKSEFDFGLEAKDAYSFSSPGGEMIYYFIYGPTYKQIISAYTKLTGKPIMPPAWALGFSQCRGMLTNEKLTREIAKGYRDREIPCDIIYQDIGWTQHLQDFEWRKGNYDDPKKMLHDLNTDGFKVIVSQDPVISQINKKQWQVADSLGFFTTDIRTGKTYDMPWPWGGNCGIVDFTKPEVADWWGNYQQKAINDGVRGFWTDMGEPAWCNEESTDRLFMKHHLGMHDEIHNVYGHTWDKVVTEQFEKHNPNQRIFQMTRAGYAGMQRYTFGWSGDAGNGNNVTEGWEQLASQIPLALSAGMGLIPFWSSDISGYCGDIKDYETFSELYIRWLQFGTFNSLSRIHHEGNNAVEPWLFGETAEKICKSAIELKYQLFPYIYSYSRKAYDTGWPLMRALMLEYPNDKETLNLNSQFLFGEELLIAPVVEEGAATKRIYLPKGEWIDFTNKTTSYKGKQWIDYPVTLEQIPLFVKEGSIVPEMPVMQYIKQLPDYPLILNVFPAKINRSASFSVYEDDGETNDYKKDVFIKRKIECFSKHKSIEIKYTEENKNNYKPQDRDLIYCLFLKEKPGAVLMEGKKIRKTKPFIYSTTQGITKNKATWFYDEESKSCVVFVPSEDRYKALVISK